MTLSEALRNRRLRLFLMAVLIPSLLVGVFMAVVVRVEKERQEFRTRRRQDQIVRLFNSGLETWLQSSRTRALPSLSLVFNAEGIVGEDLNIGFLSLLPPPRPPDQSPLMLAAKREARGDPDSIRLAQQGYVKLAGSASPAAPQARLALLRLALRAGNSPDVSLWLERLRSQDEEARTPSQIPVWVAATFLLGEGRKACAAPPSNPVFDDFFLAVGRNLVEGQWRLRVAQWTLYSREVVELLRDCQGLLPPPLERWPDLIDQVEQIAGLSGAILKLVAGRDSAPGWTANYFAELDSLLVWGHTDPVDAFWLARTDFLYLAEQNLQELLASEDFSGHVNLLEDPGGASFPLAGLPAFGILFQNGEDRSWAGHLRRHAFSYGTSALLLMAVLGFALTYRAVSRELEVARLKSDFVAAVSHEFHTPLTSIQVLLERMESGKVTDPEMAGRYYGTIRREIERLHSMVSQVLAFSRLKRGVREFDLRSEDLFEVVRGAVRSLRSPDALRRVELQCEERDPLWVNVDRAAVIRTIHNLIENGLKYSPANSTVRVRAGQSQEEAFIEVSDQGLGVPENEKDLIFDEFYRGALANTHSVKGTGLGLALVRETIHQHGGRIELQSKVGEGSCFRLILPVNLEVAAESTG